MHSLEQRVEEEPANHAWIADSLLYSANTCAANSLINRSGDSLEPAWEPFARHTGC